MGFFYLIKRNSLKFVAADLLIITMSGMLASILTFFQVSGKPFKPELIPVVLPYLSYIVPLYLFQVYRIIWRYSNFRDFFPLVYACLCGFIINLLLCIIFHDKYDLLVVMITFFFSASGLISYRVFSRLRFLRTGESSIILRNTRHPGDGSKSPILIVGAGEAGSIILSEYDRLGMSGGIIGFVDDDPAKIGTLLNGKKVLSSINNIGSIIERFRVGEVIIALPSIKRERVDNIVMLIRKEHRSIPIKILPSVMRLFETTLTPELKEIGISEILGREEVEIDLPSIQNIFSGKTVLVTGAGGSIGSELCRQLLKFNVNKLIAVGRGEHSIYELMNQLKEYSRYLDYLRQTEYRIANVTDKFRMKAIIEESRPDIIFHAAAHKHVPLMETNEVEAFFNNVAGTRNMLELSSDYGVKDFILISTDKAVNPVSIMGATKRLAEMITLYYYHEKGLNASIVRFGNVIGSRGSVVPLFQEQIRKGGPVTVTHPEMMRFFMSITEAVLLIINTVIYSKGGEVFVLDMGRQYMVDEIARKMITLYGFEPGKDIPIKYIGLRPGEKLSEELFYEYEKLRHTENKKIFMLNSEVHGYSRERVFELFSKIDNIQELDSSALRSLLGDVIPEYNGK